MGLRQAGIVDLKAGDILIFYGEHYHCSPVYRSNTVRISREIRLVSRGYDDNGWYRGGFAIFNNFLPLAEVPTPISAAPPTPAP